MNWQTAVRLPWEITLLFGGGLALAGALATTLQDSPLDRPGVEGPLKGQPIWLVMLSSVDGEVSKTGVTSNVATIRLRCSQR